MQIKWTKNWKRDKSKRGVCRGRCSFCRMYKGTTKHKPGSKKQEYRELSQVLSDALRDLDYWLAD